MQHKTVLIVEDIALERKLYSHILEARGYQVIAAEDGTEGLRRVREANPDLVLLDIHMPGMSGLDVAPAINTNEQSDRIPVIAITGALDDYTEDNILECGFDAVLPKPVRIMDLFEIVDSVLGMPPEAELNAA